MAPRSLYSLLSARLSLFCFLFFSLLPGLVSAYMLPKDFSLLAKEDRALVRDLILTNFPPFDWREEVIESQPEPMYDVAIIGGGMGGLTAGAALFKEGIFNIKLFDENPAGFEGPWITYARMKTLRSPKDLMGPALGIPHLTFHAWFDAVYGTEAWKDIKKIPTPLWMEYLKWYRKAMQLPVENETTLVDLTPLSEGFELLFTQKGKPLTVKARKVVLATGRSGFGGVVIPSYAKELPKSVCMHNIEPIDFTLLKERHIAIIGVGASSFDAAATALESGAKQVDLIMRRPHLPKINKFSSLPYKGFNNGYYKLNDEKRWAFMTAAFAESIPPPIDALKRVEKYPNFRILANTEIRSIEQQDQGLTINTNRGSWPYDFIILATGFNIDGWKQPELRRVIAEIALWKDRLPQEIIGKEEKLASFPYLGESFEFVPKDRDNKASSYLKNLYCFNYGSTMSHGLLSSDIPAISMGATRLAQGIAADFFNEQSDLYLEYLRSFDEPEFDESGFSLRIE